MHSAIDSKRPKDAALRRPSPEGIEESGKATFPRELILRDPGESLGRLRAQWRGRSERWIFGYASLIWRPEFDAAEH